ETTRSASWPARKPGWPGSSDSSTRTTGAPPRGPLEKTTHIPNRAHDGAAPYRPQGTAEVGHPHPGGAAAYPGLRPEVRGSGGARAGARERARHDPQAGSGDEARRAEARALRAGEARAPEEA